MDGHLRGQARTCRVLGSGAFAAFTATTPFDARGNDWGDPTGPHHPDTNPGGLGGPVSDNVVYDPWLTGNLARCRCRSTSPRTTPTPAGFSDEVTVHYLGGASEPIYGFSLELTWDPALLTSTVADVQLPLSGPFAAATLFQVLPREGGLRVDAALGGEATGIGQATSCACACTSTAPDYVPMPIGIELRHARDNQNQEITGITPVGGLVVADVVAPTVTLIV